MAFSRYCTKHDTNRMWGDVFRVVDAASQLGLGNELAACNAAEVGCTPYTLHAFDLCRREIEVPAEDIVSKIQGSAVDSSLHNICSRLGSRYFFNLFSFGMCLLTGAKVGLWV